MKTISVKKGEILQRKGDLNTCAYIVESGLLRSYIIDDKGKEHIYMFGTENWLVADSCHDDTPCQLFIDALEDSIITVATKGELLTSNPDLEPLLKRLNTMQNRIIMLMSSSATIRYNHFIETYPDIVKRIPQKLIASYLGITPEALSRVRHQLVYKK